MRGIIVCGIFNTETGIGSDNFMEQQKWRPSLDESTCSFCRIPSAGDVFKSEHPRFYLEDHATFDNTNEEAAASRLLKDVLIAASREEAVEGSEYGATLPCDGCVSMLPKARPHRLVGLELSDLATLRSACSAAFLVVK
jgi:hypothetical protein